MRQLKFEKTDWDHRYNYGGNLRKKRKGRKERPLSSKDPIHLVFKANREAIRGGFRTHRRFRKVHELSERYAKRFVVKIEQMSPQGDHIHMVVRISRRSMFQNFLRVFAGQIAQTFQVEGLVTMDESKDVTDTPRGTKAKRVTDTPVSQEVEKLWKHRPFTRVVKGYKAYLTVQNYVRLNEQEALGKIPYRKERLRGLEPDEWKILWS